MGRLYAVDQANSAGRFLNFRVMGMKKMLPILIPFGIGGWGWASMAKLLSEKAIPSKQIPEKTMSKNEIR